MKKTLSLVIIAVLFLTGCSSMSMAQLAGYKKAEIQQWQVTPEPGVLLDPIAAVILHIVDDEGLDADWEDSVSRVTRSPRPMKSVHDSTALWEEYSVPVRVYDPGNRYYKPGTKPLILFFHGGGFLYGSLDTHDQVARYLAEYSGGIVVSVDYRLAPRHSFPAALEDCDAALKWSIDNAEQWGADPSKIVVAGDSAGGNLSTVLSQQHRDSPDIKIALQVLFYPGIYFTMDNTPSRIYYAGNGRNFFLTEEAFMLARQGYLAEKVSDTDPRVSPLFGEFGPDLPPAYIMTAQCCPLRDEGRAYAEKLTEAGVEVVFREVPGVFHGFLNMDRYFPQVREILKESGELIRQTVR